MNYNENKPIDSPIQIPSHQIQIQFSTFTMNKFTATQKLQIKSILNYSVIAHSNICPSKCTFNFDS